jgi:hypothetical protein
MKTKEEIERILLKWQGHASDRRKELAKITAMDVLYSKKKRKNYKCLARDIVASCARITVLQQVLDIPEHLD